MVDITTMAAREHLNSTSVRSIAIRLDVSGALTAETNCPNANTAMTTP